MPTFRADQLHAVAVRILEGAGVRPEDAEIVAAELTDANLVGHDSHGVIRLMQYVDYIEQGYVKPDAGFEVVQDHPSYAVIDGHFHFGQVTATKALRLGIEKARTGGAATVVIRNCNHVGRLGSYAQKAAAQGFAGMMCVNAPGPGGVAPWGGIERRLGTNPIAMAAPWGDGALVLDMTSSASAEGKLRVAFQKGEQVPEGWIIDAEGNPATDPSVFYADPPGALLPLGGPLGFKGFGLSVMIDVVGGTEQDRARFTEAAESAGLSVGSGDVVRLLGEQETGDGDVVVALDAPYVLGESDASTAKIALYGRTPDAFRALVDVLRGGARELNRVRGPVEERVGGVAVELHVRHSEHMFAPAQDGGTPRTPTLQSSSTCPTA
jgi:hydroxycarboxylate dehydrogenase B